MNLLEKLGVAVRDGVYEVFMEYTKTTDLKELKGSGHKVDEIPLSMDGLNRLYILHREKAIQIGCTVIFDHKLGDYVVKMYKPLETKELLKQVAAGKGHTSKNN